jgi:autotransporter-associated beta strand protein/YD repeat-containing protein
VSRRAWIGVLVGLAWPFAAAAQPAFNQPFQSQGPAPSFGPEATIQSRDAPPNGTLSGGIQAVLVDPNDPSRIYLGANNGGVWLTTNGGTTWRPLTDKQSSLSISSLAYDPTDNSNRTVVAGIGNVSNGGVGGYRSGFMIGLMRTVDGGANWSELGGATLQDKSIIAVAARNNVILAASADPNDFAAAGGLYRSDDTGASFNPVSGLAAGQVTALASDSANRNFFYAAVSATTATDRGVYTSDISGSTWTKVLAMDGDEAAKVVTGAIRGSVVAAFYNTDRNSPEYNKITRIFLSRNSGATWTALQVPSGNSGQASTNLALAVDPNNPNIVYLGGAANTSADQPTLAGYRLVLQADGSTGIYSLTYTGTADGSAPHADARNFVFDRNGRLIMGGDGGAFVLTSPSDGTGSWSGLNTSALSVREAYAVAYDAVSKRIVVAAQDNGVAYQSAPGSPLYNAIGGADGLNAAVNDRTLGNRSAVYTSIQHLDGFTRWTYDAQGRVVGRTVFPTGQTEPGRLNFEADDYKVDGTPDPDDPQSGRPQLPFGTKIALNKADPTRIAIGTNYLYTTRDTGAASPTLTLLNRGLAGSQIGEVSALAYGAADNVDAVVVGSTVTVGSTSESRLYRSTTNTADSLTRISAYGATEAAPVSITFDNRFASRFYIANGAKLFGTADSGDNLQDLTANLTALNIARPLATDFISNNGVQALLTGGLVSDAAAASPIAVVNSDALGNLTGPWRSFGSGLPNTFVSALAYNPSVDALAVSLWGRGIWMMYDVTSYFSTATVLQFGLADNDSAPDSAFLYGPRPLIKYGSGTLSIGSDVTYTGTTTVKAGTLLANGSLASSSGLTIEAAGTVRGVGTLPGTTVSGTLWPGNNAIGTLAVRDSLTFNPGATYKVDASPAASSLTSVSNGAATVTLNGTVQAVLQAGTYLPSRSFTIVNTTGTVSGMFSGVVSNYPFLLPTLSYDTNDVFLTVTPGGFARGAATPNQAAVGAVLDGNVATASGDFANVITAFSLMTIDQAQAGFQAISGQNYAGFSTLNVQTAQLFMTNFVQQAGGGQTTGGGGAGGRIALAEACDVACDAADAPRWSAWGGAVGGVGTIAGSQVAPGLSFNIGGFAAGIDRRFDGGFLVGLTAGYSSATQYTQTMPGQSTSNTFQAGMYGSFSAGSFYVDALAGYARSDSQMVRPISLTGLAPRTAMGQTKADQFFGLLEGGYKVGLGGPWNAFVTPFARLQGVTATQAGFTETGADSLNLMVAGQTTNSLRSVFGVQTGASFDLGWRAKLGLVLRLGWSHEFADTARPVTAAFAGAPASPFRVTGAEAPRDGAIVGLAASTAIAEATSVYLRYDAELAGGNTSHILSGGVRIIW